MTWTTRTAWCAMACGAVLLGGSAATVAARQSAPAAPSSALDVQILLDRAGFSPGEIDGSDGPNSRHALAAFRAARHLGPGAADKALMDALGRGRVETIVPYTIAAEDTAGPFSPAIPADMTEKAKLPALNYTSALEALGEKFHCAPSVLQRLNPDAKFAAGESIRVPNVAGGEEPAPDAGGATAAKVVVSKKTSALTVYDQKGQIIFHAPVTSGSQHDPLPIGRWTVTAIARNPVFHYNPKLFWDASPGSDKAAIPPGPNNPVGVVWIDISKPHYGIHGTPEPGAIGHSESHGCVRLTNWDALRLAGLVTKGTPVVFEE